jgi:endonuclease YncB( thermonuclease family)
MARLVRLVSAILVLLASTLLVSATAPRQAQPGGLPDELSGLVVRVADGDTITVLVQREGASPQQHRIRLADIDAPEGGQPWGRQSRQMLAALVAGQEVRVVRVDSDRYGRLVGRVYLAAPPELYVNREMVRQGGAWAYLARLRDRSKLAAEADARSAGRGLWALPPAERLAPWDWRAGERERQRLAREARAKAGQAKAGQARAGQARASSSSS